MPRADSLVWHDAPACAALLAAGFGRNPKVRFTVAWMNPAAAGPEGVTLLQDLLFDEDPMVREPAHHWLATLAAADLTSVSAEFEAAQAGLAALRAELAARDHGDSEFDESTSGLASSTWRRLFDTEGLAAHLAQLQQAREPESRARMVRQLADLRSAEAIAAARALLDDPVMAVRRSAAWVLASMGDQSVAVRLHEIPDHEDSRVRVMAGFAQVCLGDERGVDRLMRLLAGDDARARDQVVRLLDRMVQSRGCEVALPLLLAAARHADPLLRGSALTTLGRQAVRLSPLLDDPQRIDAELAAAAADPSPAVRAAAAATRALQRETRWGDAERLRLLDSPRQLGYGDE